MSGETPPTGYVATTWDAACFAYCTKCQHMLACADISLRRAAHEHQRDFGHYVMPCIPEGEGEGVSEWVRCAEALPPIGQVVMTKIDDDLGLRNVQPLKRQGNLWFFADGSMYVYYSPTHWSRRTVISP